MPEQSKACALCRFWNPRGTHLPYGFGYCERNSAQSFPLDNRAVLIADICRTLDRHNRSRPWASIILWQDDTRRAFADTQRAFAHMARAFASDPVIKQGMDALREISDAYAALFAAMPVVRDRRDDHKHNLMHRYRPRTR